MKKIHVSFTLTPGQNNYVKEQALKMGIAKSTYIQLLILESMQNKGKIIYGKKN